MKLPPQPILRPPKIILLVDDASDCLEMLNMALQSIPGVLIRCSHTAEDALKLLAVDRISALITDIQLPLMTGLDLISEVRKEPALQRLPIVVVSASTDPTAPGAAFASGANAFFSKPFSPAAVRRKLEELMYA